MAVRTPLKLDGSNNLIEMSTTDINNIKNQVRYLYGTDPSVDLSYVSSGGNLGTITDIRLQLILITIVLIDCHIFIVIFI